MPINTDTARNIIRLARQHIGEEYVLGAAVAYDNADHKGPWDCAEFATWAVYQGAGVLLGCKPKDASSGEAYTGFWANDAAQYNLKISIDEALRTPGAMLFRKPRSNRVGHISISIGDGANVVEAASRALGVVERAGTGRPWDYGIVIPTQAEIDAGGPRSSTGGMLILRAQDNPRYDARVVALQDALRQHGFDPGASDGLFGEMTEKAVINYQMFIGVVVDGIVGRETGTSLGLPFWDADQAGGGGDGGGGGAAPAPAAGGVFNPKYGVTFQSLVPGGTFSADPDDLQVKRAVRTNNPGALNISNWQKSFAGYVGVTFADHAGNKTTIYRTPEHGVAAWYNLLANRYGFGMNGSFKLSRLARRYAGANSDDAPAVKAYLKGWKAWSNGDLKKNTVVRLDSASEVLRLARAMFAHESGDPSPLKDEQIDFAVARFRDGTLPG